MKKKIILSLSIAGTLAGCSNRQSDYMFETKELNGEKLEINQDFFGQRIEYVNDSNIFLVCFNSDFSVEQIKKDDDEWTVADTYGPKGQGPNEIFTTNV